MAKHISVVTSILVFLAATAAHSRTVTIDIKKSDVHAVTPADTSLGRYFVFNLPVPAKLANETLMDAVIELYVDAANTKAELADAGVTTLEIYPLRSSLTGELRQADLRPAAMKRTVRVGESQRVRINISEHIRHVLENPADNFGLVVGSLSGQRFGKFSIRQGIIGPQVAARITVIYHDLSSTSPR